MNRTVARAAYQIKRALAARHALLACLGGGALLLRGAFAEVTLSREAWLPLSALAVMALLVLARVLVLGPGERRGFARRLYQLETGALVLCFIAMAVQLTGGPASALWPMLYLGVVVLVGLHDRPVAVGIGAVALFLVAGLHFAAGTLLRDPWPALVQAGYLLGFALCAQVLVQLEVVLRRREHRRRLQAEIGKLHDEARDFRLISSALTAQERRDRAADEAKLARGAVESIHQGMYFVLELLKQSLGLQTCVLLWLDRSGERLQIKEMVTDSTMVREIPLPAHAGVLGGVVKNRILLNLRRLPRGSSGIPYYDGPEQVGVFVGVPVEEGGHLRGVLCADRKTDEPFSPAEEKLLVEATGQILRSIQTERVFAAVERSKYEHERFYRASTQLNTALTLSQVYDTAFVAAEEIVPYDFGAITLFDPDKKRHVICRVRGDDRSRFEGQVFSQSTGLVSMVVKNKHFLPAAEEPRDRDAVVFTRKLRLKGMHSLVVLPLIVKDEAIGTFVLASRQHGVLSKKVREMLGVITNQVAVAMENAKMYKKMEEMATTDGLTGLPNHRTFQRRMGEMLARAERGGKPLAVVLTDIDKFKNVNDTYGHPVGDAVLRRVSKVMAEQVRKVDHVARYGGEEFVMVLEETDAAGARLLCERVRKEVAAQIMTSEQGTFRVTLSLGIAAYPANGQEQALLIERADQALYTAKETGRNRTVSYAQAQKHVKTAQA